MGWEYSLTIEMCCVLILLIEHSRTLGHYANVVLLLLLLLYKPSPVIPKVSLVNYLLFETPSD